MGTQDVLCDVCSVGVTPIRANVTRVGRDIVATLELWTKRDDNSHNPCETAVRMKSIRSAKLVVAILLLLSIAAGGFSLACTDGHAECSEECLCISAGSCGCMPWVTPDEPNYTLIPQVSFEQYITFSSPLPTRLGPRDQFKPPRFIS